MTYLSPTTSFTGGYRWGQTSLERKGSQPQVVASQANLLSKLYLDVLEEVVDVPHEKQSRSSPGEEEKERQITSECMDSEWFYTVLFFSLH